MLIVVVIALTLWVGAGIYGFGEGVRYFRLSHQHERVGNLLEAGVRLGLGLAFFVVGLSMLSAVLAGRQVAALVFGPACLGIAFWLLRRYRRNWARFATGFHRQEVLLHLAGSIALPVVGILILAYGL